MPSLPQRSCIIVGLKALVRGARPAPALCTWRACVGKDSPSFPQGHRNVNGPCINLRHLPLHGHPVGNVLVTIRQRVKLVCPAGAVNLAFLESHSSASASFTAAAAHRPSTPQAAESGATFVPRAGVIFDSDKVRSCQHEEEGRGQKSQIKKIGKSDCFHN
jgi:hypothetical protein